MVNVEVEVVSRETIQPSSPTPHHSLHYQLSFLDQISPPVYNPWVLFYRGDDDGEDGLDVADISARLKSSLSETLTHYYPLAGRLRDNLEVDCNDEGIPYLETRVKGRLSDVIQDPDPAELQKFVPFALDAADDVSLGIQLNVLECGGIVIGLCLSHKLADALSMFMFMRTWAAICRGEANVVAPEFMASALFPPREISGFNPSTGITTENIITKRFIFGSDMIEALKAKYSAGVDLENQRQVSRVEALSTFIWGKFASSTQVFSRPERKCFLVHAVNLRAKFKPPLPEHTFGNLYRIAMTFVPPNMEEDCRDLVLRVRESVARIDQEYLDRLGDGDEHLSFINQTTNMYLKGEMITFNFTSLCRFPQYEADFGWGKPVWVGSPALTFKNLVVFKDTKSGYGIEADISLTKEDMAKFESDEELQKYTFPNCSKDLN